MIAEDWPEGVQERYWQMRKDVYISLCFEIGHAYRELETYFWESVAFEDPDHPTPSPDAFLAAALQMVKLHFTSQETI